MRLAGNGATRARWSVSPTIAGLSALLLLIAADRSLDLIKGRRSFRDVMTPGTVVLRFHADPLMLAVGWRACGSFICGLSLAAARWRHAVVNPTPTT